jgi:DNA-binding transcriptional LysR family regulator
MRTRYPRVNVRVQVDNPRDLLECVRSEEHEFFVASTREVPRNGVFQIRSLGRIRGGFYARSGHPLASRKSLQLADLLPYGIGAGRLADEVAAQLVKIMGLPDGSRLPVAVECADVHLLKQVAMGSDTVIIGTSDLLAAEIEGGAMAPLAVKDFPSAFSHSQLGIVSLEGRTPSPAAAYAMEALARLAHAKRLHRE